MIRLHGHDLEEVREGGVALELVAAHTFASSPASSFVQDICTITALEH